MMRITLKDLFKSAVLAFFWLAGTAISVAAEYYVSTTGDDTTGNGAITTPYQTIQHVLDNVAASGEIITDGQGFRVVLTPTDSPVGLPDEADMHSPDYAPDGSIVSLWLNRPGGSGDHELKVMTSDGSSYFMLVTGVDVLDIGLGCGN